MAVDVGMWNVLVMGFSFMLMFTAFQTTSMIEPTVLQRYQKLPGVQPDGYISLGIIYSVFTVANWLAPSFVGLFGPRVSMVVGGICYALFIASLIEPMVWSLYLASVIIGYGASIIWTGQGNFLTLNSNPETISRNSGIFWALLQCSLLFGNMYVYFQFKGESSISDATRRTVYVVFTSVCGLGICLLFLLRKPQTVRLNPTQNSDRELSSQDFSRTRSSSSSGQRRTALESLKIAYKLFFTKEILLLSLCFAYTGLELTFFSGVYGTCVGNTGKITDSKRQIGLVGMVIGCGEIVGGLVFGIFGKRTNRFGREPIVFLGMVVHLVCYLLIYFNLPDESPLKMQSDTSTGKVFNTPNLDIAVLCGFLLGLGDSCFNTQIYSILGFLYEEDSAPAFALFKFMQSLTAAIAFFYSLKLYLKWQLLILVISSLFGTLGFFIVEWEARASYKLKVYTPIPS